MKKLWLKIWPYIALTGITLVVLGIALQYGSSHDNCSNYPDLCYDSQQNALAFKPDDTTVSNPPKAQELLTLVNAERARNGVAPLIEDARLDQSAQFKADDEVTRHYFGHKDPATGKNNGLDDANTLIACKWVSENLHEGSIPNTAVGAVNGWISSPPHHQAMIDPKYSLTGFGISHDQVVEHFCQQ